MTAAEYNRRRRRLRAGVRSWSGNGPARQERTLASLHGGGLNPFGVFEKYTTTVLAVAGKTFAEARLARSPAGLWVGAGATGGPDWGSSSAPSLWDVAHDTQAEARLFVILECLAQLERLGSHVGDRSHREAARLDKMLRALLTTGGR